MQRGEVWWADLSKPAGKRPVLLLSRNTAIQVREFVTVAQITTVVRQIPVEVFLTRQDGMPRNCVVNCDVMNTIPKALLATRICQLSVEKMRRVEEAIQFALGMETV